MAPFLIVSAFGPELSPFRPDDQGRVDLDAKRHGALSGAVGIGPIDAALGTARAVARFSPSFVVFSGTCGAYPEAGFGVGEVVVARSVHFGDGARALGLGAMPDAQRRRFDSEGRWIEPFARAGARPADVLTLASITTDAGLAAALARESGCACEHLEAFAVAAACDAAALPWACVLGIANLVGPGARAEWLQHHHEASRLAADIVLRALAEMASRDVGA
jgi:nucleoside phosphorylase